MRTINCMIADDEQLARGILENYVTKIEGLHLVATCKNGTEVYNTLKVQTVDLLFLDINMPQLSGIELLRTLKNPPPVILTTAYREYALEGYELNVIDYLLKPISFERFLKAVDKFEQLRPPVTTSAVVATPFDDQPGFIDIKADKKMLRVLFKDILYIEGLKDYVKIHTTGKSIITYQTLTHLEKKLPAKQFIRIHRSYIIALGHINAYSSAHIEIDNKSIPIGGSYLKAVSAKLA